MKHIITLVIIALFALHSSADFASDCLNAQNPYRATLNIAALTWSDDIARSAQAWAENLANLGSLTHSSSQYGENLASRTGQYDGDISSSSSSSSTASPSDSTTPQGSTSSSEPDTSSSSNTQDNNQNTDSNSNSNSDNSNSSSSEGTSENNNNNNNNSNNQNSDSNGYFRHGRRSHNNDNNYNDNGDNEEGFQYGDEGNGDDSNNNNNNYNYTSGSFRHHRGHHNGGNYNNYNGDNGDENTVENIDNSQMSENDGGNGDDYEGGNRRLASTNPTALITALTNQWGSEKENFIYGTFPDVSNGGTVGHYTQMIWADTKQVGCGIANSDDGWVYFVCQYYPAGNMDGDKVY